MIAIAVGGALLTAAPQPLYASVPKPQLMDLHLTPNYFTYRYNNMDMAVGVVGYSYVGGMMLPLSQTADALGSFIQVNGKDGKASGWIENPENAFSLDLGKRQLTVGGDTRTIPQGAMSIIGDEVFVDAAYVGNLLGSRFLINYDIKTVDVMPDAPLRVTQRMDFMDNHFAGAQGQPLAVPNGGTLLTPNNSNTPVMLPPTAYQSGGSAIQGSGREVGTMASGGSAGSTTHTPTNGVDLNAPASSVATTTASISGSKPLMQPGKTSTGQAINWENIALDTGSENKALQAVANPMLDENSLMILQPEVDFVKGDYIEVYRHENGFYVPLGHLMDILELGIGVNPATLQASGFFVEESRQFFLDGKANRATFEGKELNFPSGLVVANPFEVYIDANLLSKVLPIDFRVDSAQLVMTIIPREDIPLQARLKREQKWSQMSGWLKHAKKRSRWADDAPQIVVPYQPVSVPTVDVRSSSRYSSISEEVTSSATVIATGDVGYVNTETFVQADSQNDDVITNLRFKAGRSDRHGKLLGPLQATEVYAGDVQAYPMPLVSRSDLGRGAVMTNRDIRRPREFDATDFFGDAQPGWEVELYRNNVLIDFQRVGEDGRYEFKDVQIYFGDNDFRIVQYGPQGQKQEEVRSFNIDNSMPKKGELKYAVSANERKETLFGLGGQNSGAGVGGWGFTGQAEYGVSESLAVNVGAARVPVRSRISGNTGTYNFISAGAQGSYEGIRAAWDVAYNVDQGGIGSRLTALSRFDRINFRAEQQLYSDYNSAQSQRSFLRPFDVDIDGDGIVDEQRITESSLVSRTQVELSRPFQLADFGSFSGSLALVNDLYEEGERETGISARVSKNVRGLNMSSGLRVRNVGGTTGNNGEFVTGTTSVNYRFDPTLQFRGYMNYEFLPDLELSGFNLTAQKQINEKLNGRLEYSQSFGTNSYERLSANLNWDLDKFYLSPNVQVDGDGEYYAGLGLVFSLGMDPRTNDILMTSDRRSNAGAISAQAFMDVNANGVRDEGEEVLPQAIFNSSNGVPNEETGITHMSVSPHYPYRLALDKGSVAFDGGTPKEDAYGVTTRPGVTAVVDYPVVPTVEIEGTAYLEQDGEQLEYPGLLLELVDGEGEVVRTVRTEFDGFYYIDDIYPGDYKLRVAKKERKNKSLSADSVSISTDEILEKDVKEWRLQGRDFVVRRDLGSAMDEVRMAEASEAEVETTDVPPTEMPDSETLAETVAPQIPATKTEEEMEVAILPEESLPAVAEIAEEPEMPEIVKPEPEPKAIYITKPKPDATTKQLFVQSGLFCEEANAIRHAETLTVAGYEAVVKDKAYNGKSCFNVQVGPQADYVAAEELVKELQNLGIAQPIIVEESAELYE